MSRMPTVPQQLRAAREAGQFTIEQAAEATKVRTDHLRALENGNYEIFSAPIYIRGSVRLYANWLKLDTPKILAALDAELKGSAKFSEPPPLVETTSTPLDQAMLWFSGFGRNPKARFAAVATAGAALIFIFGVVAWRHYQAHTRAPNLPPAIYKATDSDETLPLKR